MSKTFKFQSNHDCKDFNMIYRSTHSEYYLRVADFAWKTKNNNKKTKTPDYRVPPHFQGSEQKIKYLFHCLETLV